MFTLYFSVPIGIPGNVYAEPFNESALTIHWNPVPDTRDHMKGRLKGYKVKYIRAQLFKTNDVVS